MHYAPADAGGQADAAVTLYDVPAPKICAVDAHDDLWPAEDVGRAVRDVQREVPHQGAAAAAQRPSGGARDLRYAVLHAAQPPPVSPVQQLKLAVGVAGPWDL